MNHAGAPRAISMGHAVKLGRYRPWSVVQMWMATMFVAAATAELESHICYQVEYADGNTEWAHVHPFTGFPKSHKLLDNPACGIHPAIGDPIPADGRWVACERRNASRQIYCFPSNFPLVCCTFYLISPPYYPLVTRAVYFASSTSESMDSPLDPSLHVHCIPFLRVSIC